MDMFTLANELGKRWPAAGHFVIEKAVPLIIPFTRALGLKVEHNTPERAEMRLRLRRATRNHVGSVYFGALATLAEITMGMWAFTRFPPGPYGMLVKRVEIDFLAKAKSDIRAVCAPEPGTEEAIRRDMASAGKAERWLEVSVRNTDDEEVVRARFLAAFKDFRGK